MHSYSYSHFISTASASDHATSSSQHPPLSPLDLPLRSYSFIVDLCLHRYCERHQQHLHGPLRKIIQSYVYESLRDDTIRTAVSMWCSEDEAKIREVMRRYGHISYWDVHKVTVMSNLFRYHATFNDNINLWDVSNVKTMYCLFDRAESFNQPLDMWDVSNVENMCGTFYRALSFNQPLDTWDVRNVANMSCMFYLAKSFNQPLDTWDVSNVTRMDYMFQCATSFNQPLPH